MQERNFRYPFGVPGWVPLTPFSTHRVVWSFISDHLFHHDHDEMICHLMKTLSVQLSPRGLVKWPPPSAEMEREDTALG